MEARRFSSWTRSSSGVGARLGCSPKYASVSSVVAPPGMGGLTVVPAEASVTVEALLGGSGRGSVTGMVPDPPPSPGSVF